MNGAGYAALGLELGDFGDHAPDVLFADGGPLVAGLGHRGGWGDRVDRDELVEPIGDGGDGLIGVAGYEAGFGGGGAGSGRFHGTWAKPATKPVGVSPRCPITRKPAAHALAEGARILRPPSRGLRRDRSAFHE